jgi:nucleoid-associated protein YgaU
MIGGAVVGAAVAVAGAVTGGRVPAMLRCIEPANFGVVAFDFNPTKISMSRQTQTTTRTTPGSGSGSSGGTTGAIPGKSKPSQILISEVILEGPLTKSRCDTLLGWLYPGSAVNLVAMVIGAVRTTALPKLTFQWGPPMVGFMYDVNLTGCKVDYTRFTPMGIPIRAKISLTMMEKPSPLGSLPMNPTSGGQPGRSAHTVSAGETLQSISYARYGTPALWRRIAEVNSIHDPTRVRPGAVVYLPNPDELTAGSTS